MFDHIPLDPISSLFSIPAALLVGVQTSDQVDELLGDELLGHDQLQLGKISPLLLRQDRHSLQVPTPARRQSDRRAAIPDRTTNDCISD